MAKTPEQPNLAKNWGEAIKVYLRDYPKLIGAENTARAGNDTSRVQQTLDLEKQFDPNRTAIRDAQSAAILGDLSGDTYGLPPGLARETEQSIRGAQAARGNSYGNAPISAEALYKGKTAYDIHNRSIANAGTLLSTPSISTPDRSSQYTVGAGQGSLSLGQLGVNFGQQAYQNQLNTPNPWSSALTNAAAGAAAGTAISPGWGTAIGAVAGGIYGYASDRRLKHDIERVGTSTSGIGIFEFSYNDVPGRWRGGMADDVKAIKPEAVTNCGGFDMVNYTMLDIALERI